MGFKIILILLCPIFSLTSCRLLLSGNSLSLSPINPPKDPKNFTEYARKCGFHTEEIEVITEDGYILTLFRIPGKKKPVLLVHGVGDSSNTWILRGKKSMAIMLAKEGYDVWAGNVRGNRYGRRHVRLNPDTDQDFWDYSFHEIGYFDWPAMIDRVLHETNEKKLYGIGHSQGTTTFFVMSSLRPEYNKKVELLIGLGPVAFLDHTGPTLAAAARAGPLILPALKLLGINEIFTDSTAEKKLLEWVCSLGVLAENICSVIPLGILAGYDPDGTETEFMSLLFTQYPAGCSRTSLEHYDQLFLTKKFAQYDYGPLANLGVYGSNTPPEYDLKKVRVKTALLYGENNQIATVKDVQHLAKLLPNLVYFKAIEKKIWNHVDFLWSTEADKYVHGHIKKLLNGNFSKKRK